MTPQSLVPRKTHRRKHRTGHDFVAERVGRSFEDFRVGFLIVPRRVLFYILFSFTFFGVRV
jgi:hypothetical protein